MGRLAKEETNRVSVDRTPGFVFPVGKEVMRSYLRREHLKRWTDSNVCRHSKTLVSQPMPSRENEPLAMIRPKLKVAVGLLTGHTQLYVCFNSESHSDCVGTKVKMVCHCPELACKRFRNLGRMFLKPKDLENLRVNSPII